MTKYEALKPLQPNRRVEVYEKDENGYLVGAWLGYWNYNRGTVALYPDVKNRFVNWPNGRIPSSRRVVSDRMVTVRATIPNVQSKAPAQTTPGKIPKNIEGQESFNF